MASEREQVAQRLSEQLLSLSRDAKQAGLGLVSSLMNLARAAANRETRPVQAGLGRPRIATLLDVYILGVIITLVFQLHVRSQQCPFGELCVLSNLKAVVWAIVWPMSWLVYLAG
jgi:hypothetical protein